MQGCIIQVSVDFDRGDKVIASLAQLTNTSVAALSDDGFVTLLGLALCLEFYDESNYGGRRRPGNDDGHAERFEHRL
jgi:hypothetical protein